MPEQVYEQLTLFPGDSPANLSPWLESKKEKMMIATFGRRCEELSENLRRVGLSVRMYLESCELPLPMLYRTWSVSDITSRCLLLRLRLSVRSTGESEFSLWPTVTTMDHLPAKSEEALMREASVARPGRSRPANLRDCVTPESMAMWPTPTVMDSKGLERRLRKDATGTRSVLLSQKVALVEDQRRMYATPQARDFRTGQIERWADPKRSRNLNDQCGGQLNPTWVEWLMGFPIGWTELSASETPSAPSKPIRSSER